MTSLLIADVTLVGGGEPTSIYVEDGLISAIGARKEADHTIDGRGQVAIPGLVNAHTHAAMVLLRGYGDDMRLQEWLTERIWPAEAKLTGDDVYWGTRLACLEMIRTGTVAFADMYFYGPRMADAVHDSGLRGVVSEGFVDLDNEERRETNIKATERTVRHVRDLDDPRVVPSIGPHAIYTVSETGWEWVRDYSEEEGLLVHTHLSETETEVKDCQDVHGCSPISLLDRLGVLDRPLIAAHCVHLSEEDVRTLGAKGVWAVHNPVSNMKLAAAGIMPWAALREAGGRPVLGTDGAASNNTLDMFETMKMAALLQKLQGDPTALPAVEALDSATAWGAAALGVPGGAIIEGKAADIILVDLRCLGLQPAHDVVSNLVYAGAGSAVTTTICDGRVLMEGVESRARRRS